jgi:site-specific DNA-methyltransferase (adenine-specific)
VPKKNTSTSSFGSTKRESHDSTYFYDSKLYNQFPKPQSVPYEDNSGKIQETILNSIIHDDSQIMAEIPDNSVHLMVTSPPYNVRKEYDENLDLTQYLQLLFNVLKETWRVLVPGGRVAINIANIGRKPYIPLHAFIVNIMLEIGYVMRGEIIWNKSASAGVSCAWGSFGSASNPCLRDVHEYILVFSKQMMKLQKNEKENTIQNDEFVDFSKSIWTFPTVSAKKIGHPAPFPVELPRRLIEFYTYKEDIILDPFMGSGTTAIAAIKTHRNYIGYEIDKKYFELAQKRISSHIKDLL